MLLFESFHAINAYPFREINLNLRNQGLVRMAGPNGAGKSTVWHLFTSACQGSNPISSKKSDFMIGDKDFLLEVTFTQNNSKYVAAQAVKCKKAGPHGKPYGTGVYLFRDGEDISKHKDLDTQKLIKTTLGWSIEEWYGYVYLAQMSTHTLINGTRSDRQNYLSALFNLKPLDVLHVFFKKKADDLSEEIEGIEKSKQELAIKTQMLGSKSLDDLEQEKKELDDMLEIMESKLSKLREEQRRYETKKTLEEKLTSYQLTSPEVEIEALRSQLAGLEDEQLKHTSNKLLRSQHIQTLAALGEVAEPRMPEGWKDEYADSPDIDERKEQGELFRLTQLESTLEEVPQVQVPLDLSEVLSSPDINLAQVKRQIAEIKGRPAPPTFAKPTANQLSALRDEKAELSYRVLNLEAEVKKLQFNESECPTCGTKLDCQDREASLKAKQEELSETRDEQSVLTAKLSTQEKRLQAWLDYEALGPDRSGELPELEASVALFEKKIGYQRVQVQIDARKQWEIEAEEIKRIPELRERLRVFRLKLEARGVASQKQKYDAFVAEKSRLENLIENMPTFPSRSKEIEDLKAQIKSREGYDQLVSDLGQYKNAEDLTGRIAEFESEKSNISAQQGGLRVSIQKMRDLTKEISDIQAKIASQDKVVRNQKRYSLLAKGYGKAGALREKQLAKFSRYLEEALLSHTIRSMPEHRIQIRVDDGIDILAEYVGTAKPKSDPYDVKFMSGGEKGALSVAFLFALDDLHPPERRTNLKIIDEVEAGFDSERQQDFIQFTLPELRKRAETVIVISHSHAANAGAFDKIWEIKSGVLNDATKDPREFGEEEEEAG